MKTKLYRRMGAPRCDSSKTRQYNHAMKKLIVELGADAILPFHNIRASQFSQMIDRLRHMDEGRPPVKRATHSPRHTKNIISR